MPYVLCFLILVYCFFANARGTQTFTVSLLELLTRTSKNLGIPMQWRSLRCDLFFVWQFTLCVFFFFCLLKYFHFSIQLADSLEGSVRLCGLHRYRSPSKASFFGKFLSGLTVASNSTSLRWILPPLTLDFSSIVMSSFLE